MRAFQNSPRLRFSKATPHSPGMMQAAHAPHRSAPLLKIADFRITRVGQMKRPQRAIVPGRHCDGRLGACRCVFHRHDRPRLIPEQSMFNPRTGLIQRRQRPLNIRAAPRNRPKPGASQSVGGMRRSSGQIRMRRAALSISACVAAPRRPACGKRSCQNVPRKRLHKLPVYYLLSRPIRMVRQPLLRILISSVRSLVIPSSSLGFILFYALALYI